MVLKRSLLSRLFICILLSHQVLAKFVTYDELLTTGLEAYWNEEWEDTIMYFEKALQNFKFIEEGVWNCSKSCQPSVTPSELPWNVQYIIDKALCMEKCENEIFGDARAITRISEDAKVTLKSREIYKYLQFAYFRGGYFAKSLAATHTYLLYDPDDPMMIRNMDYFKKHENTTSDMFVNLEAYPYQVSYDLGLEAYHAEDYTKAVTLFEDALVMFYDALSKCEAVCEGEYDVGEEYPDEPTSFNQQIIDHTRAVLECHVVCPVEVARVSKKSVIRNYLPKHYSFLHHAYLQLGDNAKAATCGKAYLLFHPENAVIKANLQNLKTDSDVAPRQDAVKFYSRLRSQSELLKYLYQNFGIHDYDATILDPYLHEDHDDTEGSTSEENTPAVQSSDKEPTDTKPDVTSSSEVNDISETEIGDEYSSMKEKTDDIIESKDFHNEMMEDLRKKRDLKDQTDVSVLEGESIGRRTVDLENLLYIEDSSSLSAPPVAEGPILFEKTKLLANSSQMLGPLRFALDGLATDSECQEMIDLELAGGLQGDGYRGREHPHTQHESFEGITIHRSVQLVQERKLPLRSAELYYDLSERVRLQVKAYFKLERELYFDYTHLVCRTSLKGNEDKPRLDLSHPVHGDNCLLHEDGSCIKMAPAYTWRDYSAILYLNEDFEGGQFIMTDDTARRVKLQVKPKCGRLVSFCAGKECLHGVKPITKGRRCALALWFTQDFSHNEQLRIKAKTIIDKLRRREEL